MTSPRADWFRNNAVVLTISEYLPGEYILRVFPLICKAMQLQRFSLSLLGSTRRETLSFSPSPSLSPSSYSSSSSSSFSFFMLEGPIYGLYTRWQDLQQLLTRSHLIKALYLDNMHDQLKTIPNFPNVVRLAVDSTSWGLLGCFPKLTHLDIGVNCGFDGDEFLLALWKLPLSQLTIGCEFRHTRDDYGPPAFAQTLHTLVIKSVVIFAKIAPYCQNLKHATLPISQESIIKWSGLKLTSLTLHGNSDYAALGDHPLAKSITFTCKYFGLDGTHSNVEYVSLLNPDLHCASQLFKQCPALKHVSLTCEKWDQIVETTAVLDPHQCPQLTLSLPRQSAKWNPSLAHVEGLLERGFRINPDFLLSTRNAAQEWRRIVDDMIPEIKKWEVFRVGSMVGQLMLADGSHITSTSFPTLTAFFASFTHLSVIDIDTPEVELKIEGWTQHMVSALVNSCPVLKELKLRGGAWRGRFSLESASLCKVDLKFSGDLAGNFGVSGWGAVLKLPNVTHLSLHLWRGESSLLRALLGGGRDSLGETFIEMPRLSVLSLTSSFGWRDEEPDPLNQNYWVICDVGHQSLTQIQIKATRTLKISKLRLQILPQLKRILVSRLPRYAETEVDVPADCTVDYPLCRKNKNNEETTRDGRESKEEKVVNKNVIKQNDDGSKETVEPKEKSKTRARKRDDDGSKEKPKTRADGSEKKMKPKEKLNTRGDDDGSKKMVENKEKPNTRSMKRDDDGSKKRDNEKPKEKVEPKEKKNTIARKRDGTREKGVPKERSNTRARKRDHDGTKEKVEENSKTRARKQDDGAKEKVESKENPKTRARKRDGVKEKVEPKKPNTRARKRR